MTTTTDPISLSALDLPTSGLPAPDFHDPFHDPVPRPSRVRRAICVGTIAATIPYLSLKVLWICGVEVGVHGSGMRGGTMAAVNALTIGMDTAAAAVALALVRPWGRRIPAWLRALRPDVVLTDVRMPTLDGIQAARLILDTANATSATPTPRVVVITTFENDDYVYDALLAGASGFLLKRSRPAEIVQAVRLAAIGDTLMFPEAVRELARKHRRTPDPSTERLSEREREVLRLMAAGLENNEIAKEMFLGTQTVKTYVANILAKLDARNRTHAVVIAYRSGFVTP